MGCTFFFKKVDDLFQSSPSKDGVKLLNQPLPPPNLPRAAQYALKLTLSLPAGNLVYWESALSNFPLNYAPALGGAAALSAPLLGTPMS